MSALISLSRGLFATVDDADFDWLNQWKWSALKTKSAGSVRYYAVRVKAIDGKQRMYLMHRVITDAPRGLVVDHRDGDGLNNRRLNIRACTQSQNMMNCAGHFDRASKYKGVWLHKQNGNWCAQFRSKKLGVFESEEEAGAAYNVAALAYAPKFAVLNQAIGGDHLGHI